MFIDSIKVWEAADGTISLHIHPTEGTWFYQRGHVVNVNHHELAKLANMLEVVGPLSVLVACAPVLGISVDGVAAEMNDILAEVELPT